VACRAAIKFAGKRALSTLHTNIHMHTHAHTHACTCARAHAHTLTHMYAPTHTYTQAPRSLGTGHAMAQLAWAGHAYTVGPEGLPVPVELPVLELLESRNVQ
jgi:hypothetical protein